MSVQTSSQEPSTTDTPDRSVSALALMPYRPDLFQFTQSIAACILLGQLLFWWERMGGQPFYKFRAPCPHPNYRLGDSWIEELGGWSLKRFDNARARIATRLNGPDDLEAAIDDACKTDLSWTIPTERGTRGGASKGLIFYWEDGYHRTFYAVNDRLLAVMLSQISDEKFRPVPDRPAPKPQESRPKPQESRPKPQESPAVDPEVFDEMAHAIRQATGHDVALSLEASNLATNLIKNGFTPYDVDNAEREFRQADWRGRKGEHMPLSAVLIYVGFGKHSREYSQYYGHSRRIDENDES